jgi:serine/threonine protein kinase
MVPRLEQSPLKLPATGGAASLVSLTALITKLAARGKRLPKLALNAVMYQLTRAVAHANRLGVCHREVCPGNVMVQESSYMTELTGWEHPPARLSPYSAPELFLSEEPAILEHMKADVWSLGMVFFEGLKGSPLVKRDPQQPLQPHLVLSAWFKSIGTPSEAALRSLDPSSNFYAMPKIIQRRPWEKLLHVPRIYPDCIELLDRMLDWNPATREPAVSLLSFPYFATSRAETSMYKAVTQCELTTAEIEGIVSAVFAAHASRLAAEREVAAWMSESSSSSSSSPEPPTSESPTSDAACGKLRPRRGSISQRRGSFTGIHLVTIREDPLGEVAWRKAGTPSPQASTPSAKHARSANSSPAPPPSAKNSASGHGALFSP